jgi:hypothetical protein
MRIKELALDYLKLQVWSINNFRKEFGEIA